MEAQVGLGGSAGSAAETMRVRKRLKRRMESINRLTRRLESILLTANGVIPLDLSCLFSREAVLGPVGPAYSLSGLVVATEGYQEQWGNGCSIRLIKRPPSTAKRMSSSLASHRQFGQN